MINKSENILFFIISLVLRDPGDTPVGMGHGVITTTCTGCGIKVHHLNTWLLQAAKIKKGHFDIYYLKNYMCII